MAISTVVLVHSYTLFRKGLCQSISQLPEFRVVGEAANGQQAIQVVSETEPDMVLIDMNLPGIHGLEVAHVIKKNHPDTGIILFCPSLDCQDVVKAIRIGIAACLLNTVSWDDMVQAFYEVQKGNYPINDLVLTFPAVATLVLDTFRKLAMDQSCLQVYSPLSPREIQVLELVASNQSNKEIAASLEISNQTVKNHVSSILRKLAVNDRTQAAIYAVSQGWIGGQRIPEPTCEASSQEQ